MTPDQVFALATDRWELPPPFDALALLFAIAVAVVYVYQWVRDVRHWCAVARAMMRGAYR